MDQIESREAQQGLASRVAISILVLFGGLIVAIIYVAFFAPSFSTFQSIAVIVVVLLAIVAILGMMWATLGHKVWDG
jgi:protein-S-isoprenylcysteine O-methyltransferase Ste14